jgi:hypothetical protein
MLLWTYPSLVWAQIFSMIYSKVNQRAKIVESVMLRIATFWNKISFYILKKTPESLWISLGSPISLSPLLVTVLLPQVTTFLHNTRDTRITVGYSFITAITEHQRSVDNIPSRRPGFQHVNQLSRDVSLLQSLQAAPTPSTSIPFIRPSQPTNQYYIIYNTSNLQYQQHR